MQKSDNKDPQNSTLASETALKKIQMLEDEKSILEMRIAELLRASKDSFLVDGSRWLDQSVFSEAGFKQSAQEELFELKEQNDKLIAEKNNMQKTVKTLKMELKNLLAKQKTKLGKA